MNWVHAGTAVLAAFLASLVEFVEALTIVLAVGAIRGWRAALTGAAAGAVTLAVLVLAFGPALQRVPLTTLQLVIGILLLLFGMRWLRKAILRSAGVIGLHDEAAIYARETAALSQESAHDGTAQRIDFVALATSFKAVVLEGLEVIFIVIATGAGGMLVPASAGAAAAGVIVIGAGVVLHKPLAKVPENTLKFAVGVLLSAFGVFWIGEGMGYRWLGADLAVIALVLGFLAVSAIAVLAARSVARAPTPAERS